MAENMRELALDTLLSLEREEDYSHRLIKAVLDKYDYLDGRDKSFLKRLAEGTLERRLELDYYLNHFSKVPVNKMKPLIRCLLRMSVYQLLYMDQVPDSAVCNEACKLAAKRGYQNLKGFVNGILRTISRNKECLPLPNREAEPVKYFSVRYSMPEWLVELWLEEYGTEITEKLLQELLDIQPVSLRFCLSLTRGEAEDLCARIREQGAALTESPYLSYVYRLERGENPGALPGFAEGLYTVQDVSSALAVEAAGIQAGDFVIDVCGAPGGKSILAAEKAGRVLSRDVSGKKADLISENASRMEVENIEVQIFDGTETDLSLVEQADVVLLDVPCSGLGVLGKKRDIKYRVTKEGLKELEALQRRIARASVQYLKPGGILLYSTCTINSRENEAMVRFFTQELGLRPLSLEKALPKKVLEAKQRLAEDLRKAGKKPAVELTEEERAACVQLLPCYLEADGFFIAKFRRV